MAEVTAAAVQALRAKTGVSMMECKKALVEAKGDAEKAVELIRKSGQKTQEMRSGRSTSFGRIAIYTDFVGGKGSIVELRCESAPVTTNADFVQLGNDLAKQLATGPGAATPDELLAQKSPSKSGETLKHQLDDLFNRIREVFRVERIGRLDGSCGGYVHHNGATGVILQVEGGTPELAKDVCMHIAAMRPAVVTKDQLDPTAVAKEREILAEAARREGKPEKIIEKMVEGRLRDFYAQHCLADQPFVKDPSKTVGQIAQEGGMKLVRFIHFELPKE